MKTRIALAALLGTGTLACGTGESPVNTPDRQGTLGESGAYLSLDHYGDTDVVGFHFVIERVACDDEQPGDFEEQTIEANVDLMAGILPGMVELLEQRLDSQSKHVGSDLFVSLAPGCYEVSAAPASHIDGENWHPSEDCAVATLAEPVEVLPGETAEPPLLISQCVGDPTAQLDVPVALNQPPFLELRLEDDKFAYECSPVTVCATITDPNDDPIEVVWEQIGGEAPFDFEIGELELIDFRAGRRVWEQCATVVNQWTGEYEYRVTAYDLGVEDGQLVRMEELTGEESSITTTFPLYVNWVEERLCIDEHGDTVPVDESAVVERAPGCHYTTTEEYYCGDAFAAEHPEEASFICPNGELDEEALYPYCGDAPAEEEPPHDRH